MSSRRDPHEAELRRIVRDSDWLMSILVTVRDCDPPDWLVGGGVLYKLVWNHLHGYAETAYINDVDVVFFDPDNLSLERERAIERCLSTRRSDVPWVARNQAAVPPLRSSVEGIGANPGVATAVGVRLLMDDDLYVAAPLGLSDLFELVLRRNPRRVTSESFRQWVVKKGVREKWTKVKVIEGDIHPVPS
jgi:uncharacterized protein